MIELHPEIVPYDHGMLDVGDAQSIYWETVGNPDGAPALCLHGGPGSGCSPGWRRYFDPNRCRIILFDQRGCGRSVPHASGAGVNLAVNTTNHLLADIERLRTRLGVERWLVLGGSWGSTLALAYAQRYPERVSGLILFSVATTTESEIAWITRGVGAYLPEAWERFRDGVPDHDRHGCLADAYARLLMDPDPAVHEPAARSWCDWEIALVAPHLKAPPHPRYESAAFRLGFARLVTHYWRHRAWLAEGELLAGMGRLSGIPGALIHGRLDLGSPLVTPWRLAKAWPGAELTIIETAGHDARYPTMSAAIVAAAARVEAAARG